MQGQDGAAKAAIILRLVMSEQGCWHPADRKEPLVSFVSVLAGSILEGREGAAAQGQDGTAEGVTPPFT